MSMATQTTTLPPKVAALQSKPKNGLKSLKYWKEDILAGLVVSFVATPVSVGIAIASGAPPVAGLISAVVAGFVLPLIGGSYITISGPAAGLAPAIYAAILALSGQGNMEMGFKMLLPVLFIVGVVQMILSGLKIANYSKVFPIPVIEGMMASIGLMIIFKQIPLLIGHKFIAHEFWGIVLETPSELFQAEPTVMALGTVSLVLIIALYALRKRIRLLQTFPPQLVTVVIGTVLGQLWMLNKSFLISIPENPLANAMHISNFTTLFSQPALLAVVPGIVLTLTLIDGIESLATISAVDKIDPHKRISNPDRTLFAMGASNMCSSLAGGLTIIPEILRSSTNVLVGGKTQWANFFCAFFVLMYLILFKDVISMIPLTVLAAVVIYTGYTLCKPSLWKHTFQIGPEQFFIFVWTIGITVTFDLMWGILSGLVLAVLINYVMLMKTARQSNLPSQSAGKVFLNMFKNPVNRSFAREDEYHIVLDKALVCTNFIHLIRAMDTVPTQTNPEIRKVLLHVSQEALMVDHTAADQLFDTIDTRNESGELFFEIIGMEQFKRLSGNKKSTHLLDIEREQLSMAG